MDSIIANGVRSAPAVLVALAVIGIAGLPRVSLADDYPAKPIKLIVAFPAGGASDLSARQLGQLLSPRLGRQFVIENRPGASGAIGAMVAAAAAPDGYTLLYCNTPTHTVNPALLPDLGYDADKDFTPIVRFVTVPLILAINPTSPLRSIAEVTTVARAKPGSLRYGTAGIATLAHIAGELLAHQTGVKLTHVPYKGTAPAVTDAIGGHVDMVFMTTLEGLPQIRAGRLRALAVTGVRRVTALPQTPTMAESGVIEGELLAWFGLCAPRGVPSAVIKKLNAEAMAAYLSPNVKADLERQGYELVANTPEEFAQFIRADRARIAALVKQFGIRPE